ncbi:DUF2946 family protein [Reyranella sp.]|jgi:hypothetical protein|uniref:DUF2946 family protein n=1 Tax=Reyranella sp. TaxID=1929291 RepID=UPI002F94C95F
MDRGRSPSGWRASALAVALFAITLNFLQPLAHAALMRDGPASTLWNVICSASAADPDHDTSSHPVTANAHSCCLGLAHAVAFSAPSTAFSIVGPMSVAAAPLPTDERPNTAGIRDGPGRPRGPPLPA